MELGSERHGVDDQEVVVVEFEQDEFEEVAGEVGSDDEDLGWVRVGLEVHDDEPVVKSVKDVGLGGAMTQGRMVDVHTGYRNTNIRSREPRVSRSGSTWRRSSPDRPDRRPSSCHWSFVGSRHVHEDVIVNGRGAVGAAQRLVAGEPYEVLVGDLLSFEWEHEDDGMVHIQAEGLSPAFVRALMRIEAELLLADADAWATEGFEERTPEQRAADALVRTDQADRRGRRTCQVTRAEGRGPRDEGRSRRPSQPAISGDSADSLLVGPGTRKDLR